MVSANVYIEKLNMVASAQIKEVAVSVSADLFLVLQNIYDYVASSSISPDLDHQDHYVWDIIKRETNQRPHKQQELVEGLHLGHDDQWNDLF